MSQESGDTVSEIFRRPGDRANTDKNPHFNQSCRKDWMPYLVELGTTRGKRATSGRMCLESLSTGGKTE